MCLRTSNCLITQLLQTPNKTHLPCFRSPETVISRISGYFCPIVHTSQKEKYGQENKGENRQQEENSNHKRYSNYDVERSSKETRHCTMNSSSIETKILRQRIPRGFYQRPPKLMKNRKPLFEELDVETWKSISYIRTNGIAVSANFIRSRVRLKLS